MAKDRDAIELDAATFTVLEIYRAGQPSQWRISNGECQSDEAPSTHRKVSRYTHPYDVFCVNEKKHKAIIEQPTMR
jgi:hypothetical protein